MQGLERREARDQPFHGQGGRGAHAQRAAMHRRFELGRGGRDAFQAGLDFREISLGARQQRHPARLAGEQGLARILFKDADLLADRAVRDAQFVGRRGETAQARRRLEHAQGLQRRQAVPRHVRRQPPGRPPGAALCCSFPLLPLCRLFIVGTRPVPAACPVQPHSRG
ncbi:hypothetical protein D3C72_1500560 [compost metagenome]